MRSRVFILFVLLTVQARTQQRLVKEKKARSPKWWALAKTGEPNNILIDSHQRISNSVRRNNIFKVFTKGELKSQPLTRKQRKLVRRNPGSLSAIANAAKMAVAECQYQFRNRRWNCPTAQYMKGRSIFGKIVRIACRETAFLYAMTSAAVVHSMSRACSEGQVRSCTCDYRRTGPNGPDWQWGGCSDNIQFGYRFAREFVDAAERTRDQTYAMNMHNNQVGRLHVKSMMHRQCKCHGMSGSCTVQTCWMKLPRFRDVGNNLKMQFDGASRVLVGNTGKSTRAYNIRLYPYNPDHKPPTKKDLVYFEESPNFCVRNLRLGVQGTVGRLCNNTSIGVDGCDLMCCGRGFKTEVRQELKRCSCTFHWCCQVKCKICKIKKTIHTCL
ncbi:WNT1 (predicted) [Pycnogonum litorale]